MGNDLGKTDSTRNNIWKLWVSQGVLKTILLQAVCKSTVYSKQSTKQHWKQRCTVYRSNSMSSAFTHNHKGTGIISAVVLAGPSWTALSGRCCSPLADNGFRASINAPELFSAPSQQGWPCSVWKRFHHCLHQCSSCFHHLHSCNQHLKTSTDRASNHHWPVIRAKPEAFNQQHVHWDCVGFSLTNKM